MAYQKEQCTALGTAMGELTAGVIGGVGPEDMAALLATLTAAAQVVNEFQEVPAAAGLHVGAGLADKLGDWQLELAQQSP